jgi:hypothetical protein
MVHTALNPAAPRYLPPFVASPGQSDWLMTVMAVFLLFAVVSVGLIYLKLHALPEHTAHRTNKAQLQFVAVLALPQGSTCIANAYTSNHDALQYPNSGAFRAFVRHAIDATGLVHAAILRMQALLLLFRALVLGGGH